MLPLTQYLEDPDLILGNGLGNGLEGKDFEGYIGVHKGPSIMLEIRSCRQGVSEGAGCGVAGGHLPPSIPHRLSDRSMLWTSGALGL